MGFQEFDDTLASQLVPQNVGLVASRDMARARLEALVQGVIALVDETSPEIDVVPVLVANQTVELLQAVNHARNVRTVREWGQSSEDDVDATIFKVLHQLKQIQLHINKVVPVQQVYHTDIDYDPIVKKSCLHYAVRCLRDCQAGNAKAALLNVVSWVKRVS